MWNFTVEDRDRSIYWEPVQSLTCLLCNCSEIETETHFVIVCAFYRGLRSDIFSDIIDKDDFKQLSPEHRLCYESCQKIVQIYC